MAHPILYTPEAAKLAERGATLAEIADALGVTVRSLSRWKHRHAEFAAALKRGRQQRQPSWAADRKTASSVQHAALEVLALLRASAKAAVAADQRDEPSAAVRKPPAVNRDRRRVANETLEREQGALPGQAETEWALPLDDPLASWR